MRRFQIISISSRQEQKWKQEIEMRKARISCAVQNCLLASPSTYLVAWRTPLLQVIIIIIAFNFLFVSLIFLFSFVWSLRDDS